MKDVIDILFQKCKFYAMNKISCRNSNFLDFFPQIKACKILKYLKMDTKSPKEAEMINLMLFKLIRESVWVFWFWDKQSLIQQIFN